MDHRLSASWGTIATRGVLALAFGVVTLTWPKLTLAILFLPFAAYAILDGIFSLVSVMSESRRPRRWWPVLIEGLLSVFAGCFILFAPATATKIGFVFIGLWALFTGAMELWEGDGLFAASGVLRMLFGLLLIAQPRAGLLTLVWIVAVYAFAEGVVLLALALRLRRHASGPELTPRPA